MSEKPTSLAQMVSEWLREASVLLAVFGATLGDPERHPHVPKSWNAPTWAVDETGAVSAGAWVSAMVLLSIVTFLMALAIERRRA